MPPETAPAPCEHLFPLCVVVSFVPTLVRSFTWAVSLTPVDLLSYVTRFQWDRARYPPGLPLSSLTDLINKVQSDCQKTKSMPVWLFQSGVTWQIFMEILAKCGVVTYLTMLRVYKKGNKIIKQM